MRCPVCDSTDKWKNVDEFRIKKENMSMCGGCGFVSYPDKWKSEAEIKEYYRAAYRPGPRVNNAHAGQRKLHFHNAFLQPVFKEWQETENAAPVVGEIGAAYGMFLNMIREQYPQADVRGTELTLSYRRNCFHEFGIELTEDFDDTVQYDLLCSYKVAEHQFDVDKLLRKYVLALKPTGKFYISVPTWFGKLTNFGAGGFDLEYYYHPNHINVWTRGLFEEVLRKVGLKVVAFNDTMYDDTYLCVRDDSVMDQPAKYEKPEAILERLAAIKAAGLAYMEGRFEDAIKAWPFFPDAHIARFEGQRKQLHEAGPKAINAFVTQALKDCHGHPEIMGLAADLKMRYDQFDDAIKLFEKLLGQRPGFAPALKGIALSLRQLGHAALRENKTVDAIQYLQKSREVSRFLRQVSAADENEAVNWTYDDNARIPMPSELGVGKAAVLPFSPKPNVNQGDSDVV